MNNLKKEAQRKSEEVNKLEKRLEDKEAEILELRQRISSQQSSVEQTGINLSEKTSLLSTIAGLMERLYKAEDEQQQQNFKLTLLKKEADYHQKQAEARFLHLKLCKYQKCWLVCVAMNYVR